MNSIGVSHSVTHLDHGPIVRYRGSLQLVQEFGLDSVIRVRHIDCRCSSVIPSLPQGSRDTRCIQSNERERERERMDEWMGWMTYVGDRLVGAMVDQDLDAFYAAVNRCNMKRHIAVMLSGIDVGAPSKEELDALRMTIP